MINITSMNRDHDRKGFRNNKLHMYVGNTELHALADEWFSENGISELQVKSAAWGRIVGYINRTIAKKIETHFDAENVKESKSDRPVPSVKARYSRKCGCSCGCSPGFIVDGCLSVATYRADAWADVHVTKAEIEYMKKLIAYVTKKFLPTDRVRSVEAVEKAEAKAKQDAIDRDARAAAHKAQLAKWEAERLARIQAEKDALMGAGI